MSNRKGATLLFIGCLLMGSMGTFANFVQGTHPLNILLMRYGFALAGLLVILLMSWQSSLMQAQEKSHTKRLILPPRTVATKPGK